jgi:glycogen debranching enzyme
MTESRPLVLKDGDTFAVFDQAGEARPGGPGEEGLFHDGTRFLSLFTLDLGPHRLCCLDSSVGPLGQVVNVTLTNPFLVTEAGVPLPPATLRVWVRMFLWAGVLYQRVVVTNHGEQAVSMPLTWTFGADYADIFEVREPRRSARGRDLAAEVRPAQVTLGYHGRDDVRRQTELTFEPLPAQLTSSSARYELHLGPEGRETLDVSIACRRPDGAPRRQSFLDARAAATADLQRRRDGQCRIETSNEQITSWIGRAVADVQMLTTDTPLGPYPYAGLPWFNTPFGRDGIITALECLWMWPDLARGVLNYLAQTQATAVIPEQDAEPGKILHETRKGELAALGEIPFGQYYGSVDSTPLFVILAGAYDTRTADRPFLDAIWPAIDAALSWIDRSGDKDGDGFVEYARQYPTGLLNQGWKDADGAIIHADGTVAAGPIALCEVQGYVYAARRAAARVATTLGFHERAASLRGQADALRAAFERAFWCDDLGTYALALDGHKRPCRVRSSNAGQCLFSGIVDRQRVPRVVRALFDDDGFSGWGVRTLAAGQPRYDPMGYHTGAVWPHDNALIAQGLARCGFADEAMRLQQAMFDASAHFDRQRMPELFCGFARAAGAGPVPHALACAPQAWAAGSVLLLLQTGLGLRVEGGQRRIVLSDPRLPFGVKELAVHGLPVGDGRVDLRMVRHGARVETQLASDDDRIELVVN